MFGPGYGSDTLRDHKACSHNLDMEILSTATAHCAIRIYTFYNREHSRCPGDNGEVKNRETIFSESIVFFNFCTFIHQPEKFVLLLTSVSTGDVTENGQITIITNLI